MEPTITTNHGMVLLELVQLAPCRFLLATSNEGILRTLHAVKRSREVATTMGFDDTGDDTFIGKFFDISEARAMAERCVLRGCILNYTITSDDKSSTFIIDEPEAFTVGTEATESTEAA